MPSESRANERRLHPASLVFRIVRHARGLLLPAAAVFFFSRGEAWQVWAAVAFVPIVLLDVFRYLTLRWRYEADELVVKEGWIFRTERHVPYARIQNVDLKQNVLHRAFSVAEVTIETAGGIEAEVSLSVVSLASYEELRERAFTGRASARPAPGSSRVSTAGEPDFPASPSPLPSPPEPVLELSPLDILLLGIHPGRGLALLAISWGFAAEFGLLGDISESAERATMGPAETGAWMHSGAVLLTLAVVVGVVLLSLASSFVEFWNYRLESDGDVFRVRRGLFTREVQTIPRGRIQVVTVERPWFLTLLGRARVEVRTAGGTSAGGRGRSGGGRHFAPIVRAERVPELLARIRPGLDVGTASWRPLGRTAPRRIMISALLAMLPVAALVIFFLEWYGGALALVLVVLTVFSARRRAKNVGFARESWGVGLREGAFSIREHATFTDKIQCVDLVENPFDRRHRHATLRIDTAGALMRSGPDVAIPYLPRVEAEALREELVGAAARARFRW